MRNLLALLLLTILVVVASSVLAQTDPTAGILPFSTQVGGPIDSIDLATSSIHLNIPVRNKPGKLPFSYSLGSNSHAYFLFGVGWQVGSGLAGSLAGLGGARVSFRSTRSATCADQLDTYYYNWAVIDYTGAAHPLSALVQTDFAGCQTLPQNQQTVDGSGYTVNFTAYLSADIYDKSGNKLSGAKLSDPNGNAITNNAPAGYNDTLIPSGKPYALVFSGTFDQQESYTYTDASGNPQTVSVQYSQYTQATNFACPAGTDISAHSIYLPSSITLPAVGEYAISYEATPPGTNIPQGAVTGRIAKITLPLGGYVSYEYSGGNNGVVCLSGVVPTLTRTLNDNLGNNSVWTYVHNSSGGVTVTDPANNQTVYNFGGEFQSQVLYYQGAATGTPLKTVVTCYNGNTTNCASPSLSNSPGLPITQAGVYTSYNGGSNNLVQTNFDTYGNTIEVKQYDFGAAISATPGSTLLNDTLIYYGQSWNGTSCTAYPSGTYIRNTPCYSVTNNSAGAPVAQTQITYSNTGHPITTSRWVSGTGASAKYLRSSATYNNGNGTITTATDANGAVSTYAYNGTGGCAGLLPTSVSVAWTGPPAGSLTTGSTQWDCNGGVPTQTSDPNGQPTNYTYNDPLWRIKSMKDPAKDLTTYSYLTPNTFETVMNFATTSTSDTLVTTDGLGRPTVSQTRQAPGSSNFDSTQTAYGWTKTTSTVAGGSFIATSMPYTGSAGQPASGSTAAGATQYDAIGRPLSTTDGGGGTTSYQYINNDVVQTVGPSPTFQKQFQYNGLGQLTSVCEVNSIPGSSGPCTVQTNAESGYLTTYSYDPLGNILSVNEAGQGRTYNYDGLSRLTYEKNPESGVTQYFWDAAPSACGSGGWPTPGDIGAKVDNRGVYNCYGYDGLHRLVGVDSAGASENCRSFYYDLQSGTPPAGITVQNTTGRLEEAYTNSACNGTASIVTDEWFSYDVNGRNTDVYESTPNSGGYYHTTVGYWANNTVNTLSGVPGLSGWTFLPDGEGRPYSATYGASTNWVKSATYYPSNSQTQVTFGNGDSDVHSYDATTGRMNGFTFTVGATPKTLAGTLGWNANWTLGAMTINDGFNTANTQNCSYGYDALVRISGVACTNSAGTNIWGQDFTFDPFGNISKSVPTNDTGTSFSPTYSAATNQYTLSGCTITYDLSGNLTNDCFNTYTWDVFGDPTTVGSTTLTYDAMGRVVEIDAGSTHTEVLYSPIGKLGLMNGQIPKMTRVPLPGGSTAEIIGTGGQERTLHSDWLGSSRLSTTYGARAIAYDVAYSPYGEAYVASGSASGDLDFTGMFQDTQTGLYDFSAREYSIVGRWISPDPAGLSAVDPTNPQTWNRYAYVLNNPLSYKDPTGLECVWDDGSYDSENDQQTGSVDGCQGQGGTWVELGQLGGWSGQANAANAQLVNSIQNGLVGSVNMIGLDGQNYSTFYNGAGQTTETVTPNGTAVYVGAMLGENFQNNVGALAHSPWLLSWILPLWPLPELGIGPAGSIAWNPATRTLCGSIGAGAAVGDNMSVGPVAGRTLNGQRASSSQINRIFSGWSGSFGFNVPTGPAPVGPGVQVSANGSGAVYGPAVGVAGASVSSTYSVCASF